METSKCTFTLCTLSVYRSCFVETFDFKNISRPKCFTFAIFDSRIRSTVQQQKRRLRYAKYRKKTNLLPLFEREMFFNWRTIFQCWEKNHNIYYFVDDKTDKTVGSTFAWKNVDGNLFYPSERLTQLRIHQLRQRKTFLNTCSINN